jgi:hypothetical protein
MPEPPPARSKTSDPKTPSGPAVDVCPICAESTNLALIKGCLRCLKCGFKWDCNGW